MAKAHDKASDTAPKAKVKVRSVTGAEANAIGAGLRTGAVGIVRGYAKAGEVHGLLVASGMKAGAAWEAISVAVGMATGSASKAASANTMRQYAPAASYFAPVLTAKDYRGAVPTVYALRTLWTAREGAPITADGLDNLTLTGDRATDLISVWRHLANETGTTTEIEAANGVRDAFGPEREAKVDKAKAEGEDAGEASDSEPTVGDVIDARATASADDVLAQLVAAAIAFEMVAARLDDEQLRIATAAIAKVMKAMPRPAKGTGAAAAA